LLTTSWREVLVLNGSKLPQGNPDSFFFEINYRRGGAIFWNDAKIRVRRALWKLCGFEPPKVSIGNGCVVIDRRRCWRALQLWSWLGEHRYLFFEECGNELGALHFALRYTKKHSADDATPRAGICPPARKIFGRNG